MSRRPKMLYHSWQRFIVLLTWAYSITSKPLSPVASNPSLSLLQPSSPQVGMNFPPGFRIDPMIFVPIPELPPEAFWLNAMVAMEAAALGDFDSTMPLTRFRSQRFPQPVIAAVTPPPETSTTILRKHMVWGLYSSMLCMNNPSRGGFGMAVFGMEYGEEELGVMTFVGPPQAPTDFNTLPTDMMPSQRQKLYDLNNQTGMIESTNVTASVSDSTTKNVLASFWASTPNNESITTQSSLSSDSSDF